MYTTPLSTIISSCSLNHHLYADDTQLFLSFLPTHLDSSIDHFHDALDRISCWMTANLLTLNSSKTEFLLIGLSKQLAKINNSSLTTTHSSRNLGFIFICQKSYLVFYHPLTFIPGLKPSFSANPSHRSPSFFFFRIHYMDSPDCLVLFLSISIFYF